MELQNRSMEMRQHVVRISNQVATMERDQTVAQITINHLETLPPGTVTYRPLGKCFVLEPREELTIRMNNAIEKNGREAEVKLKLRQQFVDKLKENEDQLEELMDQIEKTSKARSS